MNRQKVKANGNCPIMGRITLDGKICQYSTGEEVAPALWNAEAGRVIVRGRNSEETKPLKAINDRLDELEQRARLAHKKHTDTTGFVSAEIIKNAVTGQVQAKETLLTLFDEHNEEFAKRVGIDRVRKTWMRYIISRKHIHNFLRYKYDMEDVPLRSIEMQFIHDFHFYLSTVLKIKTIALLSAVKISTLAHIRTRKGKTFARNPSTVVIFACKTGWVSILRPFPTRLNR